MATRMIDVFIQQGRLGEWITSGALLLFALILAMPGNSFTVKDGFDGFYALGFTEIAVAIPFSVIAALRMLALVVNGAWRRSPHLRVVGSIGGAICFMIVAFGMLIPYFIGRADSINPAAGFPVILLIADGFAAYRAGADAGNNARLNPGAHEIDRGSDRGDYRDGYSDGISGDERLEEDTRRGRLNSEDGSAGLHSGRYSKPATQVRGFALQG